jgi:hypothetical protein
MDSKAGFHDSRGIVVDFRQSLTHGKPEKKNRSIKDLVGNK